VITGAILAGGKSRRFGRNKTVEVLGGKRLINHCLEGLDGLCDPLVVVANDLEPYWDLQVSLIRDLVPHQGPLGGIQAALTWSPHDWVFVKAADMPFLVPGLVRMMLASTVDADLVVPVHDKGFEPLFALYNRRCRPAIDRILQSSERSVAAIFEMVRLKTVGEKQWRKVDAEGLSFMNVNTPEDWADLVAIDRINRIKN
jgi:molybdopterin-guanine dinucleotide biosynthesis protein A